VPPLLQHLGIGDAFALVLGGDSLPQRKPSGEPLRHIAAHFGLAVDACLMVGDSLTDYRAAEEAGMPIALVRYGYPRGLDLATAHAVAVIDDLRELPGLPGDGCRAGRSAGNACVAEHARLCRISAGRCPARAFISAGNARSAGTRGRAG
jgi:hypothetical protein